MSAYVALTKPGITWLIVASTAIGYVFGAPAGCGFIDFAARLDLWRLFHTLLGTALLASGTAALNQWWEREDDAKMRRTAARPIPSGAVTPSRALLFGVAISLAGFGELILGVNRASAVLGLATLATYLFVYTPLKRRSWLSTAVGAIPGAMPPVIGFAAAGGSAAASAAMLFAILFLWQFPHFYAIAWMYREDYARAGIRMLPVVEPDCRSTARQMLISCIALMIASVVPAGLGVSGFYYAAGALALGCWLLYSILRVSRERTRLRARGVLLGSVVYLPVLYCLLLLDRSW
ncbi:MAG TPA: heme o synthase [Bryobacteraceae bacterium]|nr:heme o synthase [Bryobacteraceae bacterium]